MPVNADTLSAIIEMLKQYFQDLIRPDMTIDKIAEVASPNLDKIIKKNEEKGLKYSAGKFKIEYLNDKQFTLEFEMYFKDDAGKWYKAANKSEPRDAELIEPSSWKTLKALKVVEFPIGAPADEEDKPKTTEESSQSAKPQTAKELPQSTSENIDAPKTIEKSTNEITLDKLMGNKK